MSYDLKSVTNNITLWRKTFWNSMKKFSKIWIFTIIIFVLTMVLFKDHENKQIKPYNEMLDEVLAVVENETITLREFAVYVAHEEAEVHEQALAYDPKNTKKYWGLHTNGQFIKVAARNATVSMAVHDELFYQLAMEKNLTLTEQEEQMLANDVMDFWADLTEDGKEQKLGISKEDVEQALQKIAIAEKAQAVYAKLNNVKYEDYHFEGEEFSEFLSQYDYKVDEKIVDKLDFGDITLSH
ncbi:MAG: hypothetical protein IKJ01_01450 [Lachnospiraceae bacterium]|nr:hypothetical protein [Lachnospiraceae bacterium]